MKKYIFSLKYYSSYFQNIITYHTLAVPNNPLGLINKTNTTNNVANIFAKFGEKKTDIIPSLIPIRTAAATVPLRLPKPPIMTTIKARSNFQSYQ